MRLPVSGLEVGFRLPDGYDDLAILEYRAALCGDESQSSLVERALDALSRLARLEAASFATASIVTMPNSDQAEQKAREDSGDRRATNTFWASLTITDFESVLLGLRRFLFGDIVRCVVRCTCSERMEIEFSIAQLLDDVHPRIPRRVLPSATRPGWFDLHPKPLQQIEQTDESEEAARDIPTAFRLPVVADQLLALQSSNPYDLLEQRCVEAIQPNSRTMAALERVMEAMAPVVSRPIDALCTVCGATLNSQLHVASLVLDELCASASHVHGEIHAIAATYHWDESTILAMPQLRRQAYSGAIREGGTL